MGQAQGAGNAAFAAYGVVDVFFLMGWQQACVEHMRGELAGPLATHALGPAK